MRFAGRRRLVERTTARCCRSTCRRPEVDVSLLGFRSPTFASLHLHCELVDMKTPHSRSRVLYRVYSKDEYLAGTDQIAGSDVGLPASPDDTQPVGLFPVRTSCRGSSPSHSHAPPPSRTSVVTESRRRSCRRLAGVAVLASAAGVAGALSTATMRSGRPAHPPARVKPTQASARVDPASLGRVQHHTHRTGSSRRAGARRWPRMSDRRRYASSRVRAPLRLAQFRRPSSRLKVARIEIAVASRVPGRAEPNAAGNTSPGDFGFER
jgi:hypothetical protein